MTRALIGVLLLLPTAAFTQPAAAKPAFEIADVHSSPRTDWSKTVDHWLQGGYLAVDRYELRRATMLDMIRIAYNVDAEKIYGGPAWLDYDRFEVIAKTTRGTRPEVLRLMLQSLLEDRFHLVAKPDTRPVSGYILSKGKRDLKLKASADSSGGCRMHTVTDGVMRSELECRNATMEAFARAIRGRFGNLPVIDSTGLEGGWDIDLVYSVARPITAGMATNEDMIAELDRLGLKIEPGKVSQPVLVVESVNQQPSPNPPAVAELLPPLPPPQFEVASIKLPCEGNASISPKFETGGRVTATCMAPMSLISEAWSLAPFQGVAGAPKWLTEDSTAHNISIAAKAPSGVAPDPEHNQMARDIVKTMLRALLIERYKMEVHYETRPMDSHTLVAVKPKLTKADPAGRTGCTRQNLPGRGETRLTCLNMTMAQWAEQMQGYDTQIYYPVQDATGLEGAWDFTLQYDPLVSLRARFPQFGGAPGAANGEASDPTGSLSFTAAIEKQLGLKVEIRKRPQQVLVIDRMEEKPTEN